MKSNITIKVILFACNLPSPSLISVLKEGQSSFEWVVNDVGPSLLGLSFLFFVSQCHREIEIMTGDLIACHPH